MTIVSASDPGVVDRIVERLHAGEPVVVPTDTVYGLAALPAGIERVRELKQRPPSRAIPLLVSGPDALDTVAVAPSEAERALAEAFWPGPLTLVVDAAPGPLTAAVSDDDTAGVRCPAERLIRRIAARVGPLPTTSANLHGKPTPPDAASVAAALGATDLLVVDGGIRTGGASTVLRLRPGPPPSVEVLRAGPVSAADATAVIAAAAGRP